MDGTYQESIEEVRLRIDKDKDVLLTTVDQKRIVAELEVVKRSNVIKGAIEDVDEPGGYPTITRLEEETDKDGKVVVKDGEAVVKEIKIPCAHWIPLLKVTEPVLKKVLEWCSHHRNDPPVAQDEDGDNRKKSTDIEEWDQKFLQVDQEMLFELILAANYMDIKPLLDAGCKTVANMIKGKSPEEIRKTFNIQNDFTPEEEDQIRRENEWAEDR